MQLTNLINSNHDWGRDMYVVHAKHKARQLPPLTPVSSPHCLHGIPPHFHAIFTLTTPILSPKHFLSPKDITHIVPKIKWLGGAIVALSYQNSLLEP